MNIGVYGPINTKTSIGEACRRNIACLNIAGFSTFSFDPTQQTNSINNIFLEKFTNKFSHPIKYFHFSVPFYATLKNNSNSHKNKNQTRIGYFVWDSNKIHTEYIKIFEDFDQIWTPSTFCKNIFSEHIDEKKIKIVPHPIKPYNKKNKKFSDFTILIINNIFSNLERKNLKNNIEVAKKLKKNKSGVRIILKTICTNSDDFAIIKKICNDGVEIISSFFDSNEMNDLISQSHVLLSLHRCEGYGLSIAEAQNVGTLVISTNYSGSTDLVSDNTGIPVDYKIIDIKNNFYVGQWAEPNLIDAYEKLENVYNNYEKYSTIIENAKNSPKTFVEVSNIIGYNISPSYTPKNDNYTKLLAHPLSYDDNSFGGLFNPCVHEDNIIFRKEKIIDNQKSSVYDTNSNPICLSDDGSITILNTINEEKMEKFEDFRHFTFNYKQYITHTHIKNTNISTAISEISNFNISKTYVPEILNFQLKKIEKNWSYLEYNHNLFLIYSINPFIVFKMTNNLFEFELFKNIKHNIFASKFSSAFLSNSINPIDINENYFYHIIHFNGGNKTYKHYSLLINKNTLLPEKISKYPIFEKNNCYGIFNNLLYLTDWKIIETNNIRFYFGEGDCCSTYKDMSYEELLNIEWESIE